jgi:hypothetical protein
MALKDPVPGLFSQGWANNFDALAVVMSHIYPPYAELLIRPFRVLNMCYPTYANICYINFIKNAVYKRFIFIGTLISSMDHAP